MRHQVIIKLSSPHQVILLGIQKKNLYDKVINKILEMNFLCLYNLPGQNVCVVGGFPGEH